MGNYGSQQNTKPDKLVTKGPISEKDFTANVIELAQRLGWKVAHFRSIKTITPDWQTRYCTPVQGDGEGFPDLEMWRRGKVIYAELKSENGRMSPNQIEWMNEISLTHAFYLWRPKDWDEIIGVLK